MACFFFSFIYIIIYNSKFYLENQINPLSFLYASKFNDLRGKLAEFAEIPAGIANCVSKIY
jgi:hypothetical protein